MIGIDQFAGLGGWSEGARLARVPIVWAANHWLPAVKCHHANFPKTRHVCQDLQQADWTLLPRHDAFFTSPACQGHTHARGRERPHHDARRSTAWAVVSCAEVHREPVGVLENVVEFLEWELYPAFAQAMRTLGYALAPHIIDAADHGVPQNRPRVYIVFTRSKAPLWLKLPKREHVAAETILDADGAWSPVRTKCPATRARIARGRREIGRRFLMPYYGSGSGLTGRSLDRPIGTITTRDRWALVEGDRMRMLSVNECRRAMSFRESYVLPESGTLAKAMLGNAVCPVVARDIILALKEAA